MDSSFLINYIDSVLSEIDSNNVSSAYFYAFKSKVDVSNTNRYISLDYEFYDTSMNKEDVMYSIEGILDYLKNVRLKPDSVFEPYNINNSKKIIDYITLQDLDFSDINISSGNSTTLDSDNYKVQFFLNSLKRCSNIARSTRDYRGLKHTVLQLTTNNNLNITIINKGNPLYKAKGYWYVFPNDDIVDTTSSEFKLIKNHILKIPFYPQILIINGYCFMLVDFIESVFGFEEYNKKICKNSLNAIQSDVSFEGTSFDFIDDFVNSKKNYNLFSNFDKTILDKVISNDPSIINILKNDAKVTLNPNNEISINNVEEAQRFIYFICGFIKKDIITNNTEIAEKFIPLPLP